MNSPDLDFNCLFRGLNGCFGGLLLHRFGGLLDSSGDICSVLWSISFSTRIRLLLPSRGCAFTSSTVFRFELLRSKLLVAFTLKLGTTRIAILRRGGGESMVSRSLTLPAALARVLALTMVLLPTLRVVHLTLFGSHRRVTLTILLTARCQLILMRLRLLGWLVVGSLVFDSLFTVALAALFVLLRLAGCSLLIGLHGQSSGSALVGSINRHRRSHSCSGCLRNHGTGLVVLRHSGSGGGCSCLSSYILHILFSLIVGAHFLD
mmetsp:Transcript_126061/g.352995  ORF Transcript_126061/g.352995 Transcript_126061/m.352995 type:complete len:263 (+) Transcript_126061:164-952(+)